MGGSATNLKATLIDVPFAASSGRFAERTACIVRARAPLRIGLAGGGTDVSPFCDLYGGAILNATIDSYAYATLEATDTDMVSFVSSDDSVTYQSSTAIAPDGRLDLLKAVYNYMVREYNHEKPLSVRISTRVDVPAGSGLGSSSTLVVAVIKAFAEALRLPLAEYEIAQAAYVMERIDARLQGGRQDQYAATFGGFNFMEFGANGHVLVNPLRIKDWVVSELEASMVLFYTGQSRLSSEIIAAQVRNVERDDADALAAMHELKREAFDMKDSLLRGDFPKLYKILRSNWAAKKRMAANISNDLIERLYARALAAGATCGKISGAGGGGFLVFFADPTQKHKVAAALLAEHESGLVFGCHFTSRGAEAWRLPTETSCSYSTESGRTP
jgi:D-glycero-alpha-D-manno-heptose-7-phosphate kinase